jgi:hypothetical protein
VLLSQVFVPCCRDAHSFAPLSYSAPAQAATIKGPWPILSSIARLKEWGMKTKESLLLLFIGLTIWILVTVYYAYRGPRVLETTDFR